MSEVVKEVAILSAFGRGNWLAAELVEKGFSVQLLDVSEQMGRWAPEDWEGPFGLLQVDHMTNLQANRLAEEDYFDQLKEGVTVWPPAGPLDMRGYLTPHWVNQDPAMRRLRHYLQNYFTMNSAEREELQDEFFDLGFDETWLVHLAHQWASNVFRDQALNFGDGEPLALFSPFSIRRITRKGLQKSLDWCREKGVEVLANLKPVDVAIESGSLKALQVAGETTKVVTAENFVWCLSSGETKWLAPHAAEKLFPKGALAPEWCWMRWRLTGDFGLHSDVVAKHWIQIQDLGLPWTHDNFLVVQRCEVAHLFDVWARVPSHQRFQRAYIEEFGALIENRVNARVPHLNGRIQDKPQDYHYDFTELGPSLFPVFAEAELKKFSWRHLNQFYFDGVESVKNMDWTGRFKHQEKLVLELVKWKQKKMAKAARGGNLDRQIHAP